MELLLLLLFSLLVLAKSATIPGFRSISKPGECPVLRNAADIECPLPPSLHNTIEFNSFLMTIAGCLFDGDCHGSDKCCFDGCKTMCMKVDIAKIISNQSSQCPEVKEARLDCVYVDDSTRVGDCQTDKDCKVSENCCYDGCRKVCIRAKAQEKVLVKDGLCPPVDEAECSGLLLDVDAVPGGQSLCNTDRDCNGTSKCCINGCRLKCIEPLIIGKAKREEITGDENEKSDTAMENKKADINSREQRTGSKGKSNWVGRKERTFVMIKPEAIRRGLIAEIVDRFERKGYKLVGIKLSKPSRRLLLEHYIHLKVKSLLEDMLEYIGPGPVVAMIWEGAGAVDGAKAILGTADSLSAKPGTVRGDFTSQMGRDIVYSSTSRDRAEREIGLWFNKDELVGW